MTLSEKIGQLLMVGFRGLAVDDRSPIVRDIRAGRVGGVVLFDRDLALDAPERNIRTPGQVKKLVAALQKAAAHPPAGGRGPGRGASGAAEAKARLPGNGRSRKAWASATIRKKRGARRKPSPPHWPRPAST